MTGSNGSEPVGERVRIFQRGRTWYANFQDGHKQQRPSLQTTNKKEGRGESKVPEMRMMITRVLKRIQHKQKKHRQDGDAK